MKATIRIDTVSEGVIAEIHGMRYKVTRLHVPKAKNLVITVHKGEK